MAHLIDGKLFAADIRQQVSEKVKYLKSNHNLTAGLAVVLIGDNEASQVYVRNKIIQTSRAGMNSFHNKLDSGVTERDLLDLVGRLNSDPLVNGILVQLPLPDHIDPNNITSTITPLKDVDGFHVINTGRLNLGLDGMVPCTPLGCIQLLKSYRSDITGCHAVIIGRSNIVGKPLAAMLLRENCTVTIAHSRSKQLDNICRQADILVAAVGKAGLVRGSWIKPGAIVIDVGINRVRGETGKLQIVGDVDFAEAEKVAGAITPVPGGVGPMTIASLLQNTVKAACLQHQIELPDIFEV